MPRPDGYGTDPGDPTRTHTVGGVGHQLAADQVEEFVAKVFGDAELHGKKVCLVVLDGTRSCFRGGAVQAHLFREIRNYALHPVEEHDADRETWLTETGATLLMISARRYFVKLSRLHARLAGAEGT